MYWLSFAASFSAAKEARERAMPGRVRRTRRSDHDPTVRRRWPLRQSPYPPPLPRPCPSGSFSSFRLSLFFFALFSVFRFLFFCCLCGAATETIITGKGQLDIERRDDDLWDLCFLCPMAGVATTALC